MPEDVGVNDALCTAIIDSSKQSMEAAKAYLGRRITATDFKTVVTSDALVLTGSADGLTDELTEEGGL